MALKFGKNSFERSGVTYRQATAKSDPTRSYYAVNKKGEATGAKIARRTGDRIRSPQHLTNERRAAINKAKRELAGEAAKPRKPRSDKGKARKVPAAPPPARPGALPAVPAPPPITQHLYDKYRSHIDRWARKHNQTDKEALADPRLRKLIHELESGPKHRRWGEIMMEFDYFTADQFEEYFGEATA